MVEVLSSDRKSNYTILDGYIYLIRISEIARRLYKSSLGIYRAPR